jgi:exodeoxyribonuclease V beta subunit
MLREVVARRCSVRGWARWIDPLTDWLTRIIRIITTPFVITAEHGMRAASIALSRLPVVLGEMEFWFAADRVDTLELERLVTAGTFGGADQPMLELAQLNGMLKGITDLVYVHDCRYYVADYKSNWLGADEAAYTAERIP